MRAWSTYTPKEDRRHGSGKATVLLRLHKALLFHLFGEESGGCLRQLQFQLAHLPVLLNGT